MEMRRVRLKVRIGRRWEIRDLEIPTDKEIRSLAVKLHAARHAYHEKLGDFEVRYAPSRPFEYTANEFDPLERRVRNEKQVKIDVPARFEIRYGEWLKHVWRIVFVWVDGDDQPPSISRDEKNLLPPLDAMQPRLLSDNAEVGQKGAESTQPLLEGDVHQAGVNVYERSPEARRQCIEHYGPRCFACGFDFGDVYGCVAEGYIHVHHLIPISEVGEEYVIDPVADLRPLCPNCHAVAHLRTPPYGIEELQAFLRPGSHL